MDLQKPFRDIIEKVAEEHNYNDYSIKITPITSGGSNYTSVLYTGTISAPNKEDLELFAKTASFSAKLREEAPISLFDTERFAYEELVKSYEKIQKEHGIPDEDKLVLSKFYGSNKNVCEETIVLENLVAKGYTHHNRLQSVDWPYASKAVEAMAKFHALSMIFAEENPEAFQKHVERLKSSVDTLSVMIKSGFDSILPYTLAALREENAEKLRKFFENEENRDMNFIFSPVRKTVLGHGDYRPSNLMHRNNKDGSVDVIPVDLQTILPCSGVIDLAYFIFIGTDGPFRKQYYTKLVDHYYNSLSRALKAFGLDPEKVYSRADFDYDLQERLRYGLIAAAFSMPIVTIDEKDAPNLGDDELDMNNMKIKPSKLLPQRINDIVDDFVAWGLL